MAGWLVTGDFMISIDETRTCQPAVGRGRAAARGGRGSTSNFKQDAPELFHHYSHFRNPPLIMKRRVASTAAPAGVLRLQPPQPSSQPQLPQHLLRRCQSSAARSEEWHDWHRITHKVRAHQEESQLAQPTYVTHPKAVEIIGAPMTYGQPLAGADHGPALIRSKGLRDALASLDWRVHDQGDLKFDAPSPDNAKLLSRLGKARNSVAVGRGCRQLSEAVERAIQSERFPLVIGGDHSIGLGSVAGVLNMRPNVGILWVDAHADMNTPRGSPSGNMHGMPLAFLLRDKCEVPNPEEIPGLEWLAGATALDPAQLVYIGLRDVDADEARFIQQLGIRHFSMKHIDRYGIGAVMDMALEHLRGRPIHMSFDIDAVDPYFAPSTGTLVRGGLNYREASCESTRDSDWLRCRCR
jgi:arginase